MLLPACSNTGMVTVLRSLAGAAPSAGVLRSPCGFSTSEVSHELPFIMIPLLVYFSCIRTKKEMKCFLCPLLYGNKPGPPQNIQNPEQEYKWGPTNTCLNTLKLHRKSISCQIEFILVSGPGKCASTVTWEARFKRGILGVCGAPNDSVRRHSLCPPNCPFSRVLSFRWGRDLGQAS